MFKELILEKFGAILKQIIIFFKCFELPFFIEINANGIKKSAISTIVPSQFVPETV